MILRCGLSTYFITSRTTGTCSLFCSLSPFAADVAEIPGKGGTFSSIAEKNGLIVTGGSDFHSLNLNNGQIYMGKNFVPDWIYNELLNEKKRLDLACK